MSGKYKKANSYGNMLEMEITKITHIHTGNQRLVIFHRFPMIMNKIYYYKSFFTLNLSAPLLY